MPLEYSKRRFVETSIKWLTISSTILFAMKTEVLALINPNAGFSYITFDKNDICSNIFNDNPCGYMKNILKVFLDTSQHEKSIFVDQIRRLEEDVELLKKKPRKISPNLSPLHNFSKRSNFQQKPPIQKRPPKFLQILRFINHFLSQATEDIKRILKLNPHSPLEDITAVSIWHKNYVIFVYCILYENCIKFNLIILNYTLEPLKGRRRIC